jgi:potassium voltage-gated channel Eag-related subfamily H protein 8
LSESHDTATGPDEIRYQILKHLPESSLKCFLSIFNKIWQSGNFPKSWKETTIIAILKPGKCNSDPSNYRPIPITSCVCKTINDRLVWFLESQSLLADIQCGFRSQRSTCTLDHLVKLQSFICDAFINNEHAVSIFFNFKKAYDTTWRYGILRDLHGMGLRGNLPMFVSNFLTERQFKVRLGSAYSNLYDQENGVPHGSILLVTLFSIKINSLAQVLKNDIESCLLVHVDDFGISYMYCSKNMASIERQLQFCLNKIQDWADNNGFKFSN